MFARVSSYTPGPQSTGAPSEETIERVLDMPGCRGIYYLFARDTSLSVTLWADENALKGSHQAADRIRDETSAEQGMTVRSVEEFEVLTSRLNE